MEGYAFLMLLHMPSLGRFLIFEASELLFLKNEVHVSGRCTVRTWNILVDYYAQNKI